MNERTRERLVALNREFYSEFAEPFAATRANPQPGFHRLLAYVTADCHRVLDVGCGEGRFGRFLRGARPSIGYVGVDFSAGLLGVVQETIEDAIVFQRDLSAEGSLQDLGRYGFVVCLAVLQHLPGRSNRARLLAEMSERLQGNGSIAVSTWQFLDSARQRKKIAAWDAIGVSPEAVEDGDYVLTWKAGGYGVRYVAHIDEREMELLAQEAGLRIVDSFRSDGKEGNLNLYTVLSSPDGVRSS